nr:DUF4421 family protein [uncultured Flavobacterium sp.]
MGLKIIVFFWFVGLLCCKAQEPSAQKDYFKSYDEKVIGSTYFFNTSNNFQFVSKVNGKDNYVDLVPNRREQIGFNLSYKFIDLSYGVSPLFFDVNKDNSNSRLVNFGTRFIIKQWMQTLLYSNQKGFYVSAEDFAIALPKMRSIKIGGTTSYIFNPKFSFKTIANQNQWQTKSSGSFIPTLSIYNTYLNLNDGIEANRSKIWLVTLAPSYYYNWVISNHVLISSGIAVGGGFNDVDGDFSGVIESTINLKLGYNSDSFFTFVNVNYTNFSQDVNSSIRFNEDISTFRVTAGYRFDPPKKVKQLYDKGAKAIGL